MNFNKSAPKTALFPNYFRNCEKFIAQDALAIFFCFTAMLTAATSISFSQTIPTKSAESLIVHGIVLSVEGKPVSAARVNLTNEDGNTSDVKLSSDKGEFVLSVIPTGTYLLNAEKLGKHSHRLLLSPDTIQATTIIELVLDQEDPSPVNTAAPKPSPGAMEFADQPNFTVAGVTDFTAAGGHGSDSTLRTSEALALETASLKPDGAGGNKESGNISSEDEEELRSAFAKSPDSFDANHQLGELYFRTGRYSKAIPLLQSAYQINKQNRGNEYDLARACKAIGDPAHSKKYVVELLASQENGDLYRLAAELDESLGDSLTAVREYQKAASLEPSEANFFAWGSELLLHRAIWQAQQVFDEGAKHYPASSRMLTGLGTALFSGAAYEQAALRLCEASDLNPTDTEPYIFLGKAQMAAPNRLRCIEERLHRFVREQPGSAVANYLYAMALQKQEGYAADLEAKKRSETLLRNAVAIDPNYSEAYLQLGILYASQKNFAQAIDFYKKAIAANPQMSDAYYRLAVAYDRIGEPTKAREEFALHDAVAKQQAADTERQRQEVKQFLVVLPPEPAHARTP